MVEWMDHILSLLVLLAFSIGANTDQATDPTHMSPGTDSNTMQPQPSIQNPFSNDDTEEMQPSSLNNSGSNNDELQLSSLSNVSDSADGQQSSSLPDTSSSATQLSPTGGIPSYDRNPNAEHLRRQPEGSLHAGSHTTDHLRLPNGTVPHIDENGRQRLQSGTSPGRGSSQVPDLSNPNSYNFQSHGGHGSVNGVSMENPMFYEVHGNQNVIHYGKASPLKQLAKRAMLDAAVDSSARDPPPRCHPGTRLDILQLIQQRLDEIELQAQMMWLEGAAGVGKSAIMQTIAEANMENDALGASVFFSRPNNRDDPQMVFTTIAFQLAVKEPSYQQYITQRIAADPSLLKKSMERLFYDLIIVPFAQLQLLGADRKCIIVLDGLDECKDTREQRRIIKLIGDFVSQYPTVPIRWVIASRPEQHLVVGFSEITTLLKTAYWQKQVPIDSEQSVRDVELYLHNEFTRIRDHNHDLMATYEKWPDEKQFLTISSVASGLFVFASTVIRFVDDDENPVHRLNLVMSVLEKQSKQNLRTNPLALLDALYQRIISDISPDALDTAKLVLGYLIIRPRINEHELPTEPFWICNMLGIEQHALYGVLRKLRSVLSIPEPEHAFDEQVRFLHASFSDYLEDRKRSETYSVNLDEIVTHLWRRFMTILQQWMKTNSHESVELAWSIESIVKLMQSQDIDPPLPGKGRLPESARWSWSILLEKHFRDGPLHLLLPVEDLIEDIGKLDYSFKWALPCTADNTSDLIKCLEAHAHIDHRKDIIHEISLASLDRKQLLTSMYERLWINGFEPFVTPDPETKQIFKNDLEKLEESLRTQSNHARQVLDLVKDANTSGVMVKVLGAHPSRCRAVIFRAGEPLHCFPYIA